MDHKVNVSQRYKESFERLWNWKKSGVSKRNKTWTHGK